MEKLDYLLAELSLALKSADSPDSKTKIINSRDEDLLPPPPKSITNADMVHVVDYDELPFPPPPPEAYESNTEYKEQFSKNSNTKGSQTSGLGAPCTININLPPPPKDLLPPPSSVNSSYSELRGTQLGSDFHNYGMGPGVSSPYESVYEPVNPKPPSQMSSISNYSPYASYNGASLGSSPSVSRIGQNKEKEVDNLTDMLIQGMGPEPDLDQEVIYGICAKCGDKVWFAVLQSNIN
ncbi:hypothetical protein GWI33_023393 [Rhynchophorus ferrugineus]|uniref:Uncharacterized protein n=1 Tax=Rhynchophorus ferrugineus TaxID=354439 RepID=A0A834LXZ6_RHYFE|nr:hypothetical protein GWI33_023393 [Rhynchophorus ferrugineus]